MSASTLEAALDTGSTYASYTTAGRHRRDVGAGCIRLTASVDLDVLVNGFAVAAGAGTTTIRVPAGPMQVEVRRAGLPRAAVTTFALGEDAVVDLLFTEPRLGLGAGRLQVTAALAA